MNFEEKFKTLKGWKDIESGSRRSSSSRERDFVGGKENYSLTL